MIKGNYARTFAMKGFKLSMTKQVIKLNSCIDDTECSIPENFSIDLPPYFDPAKKEFWENDRVIALYKYWSNLDKYEGSVSSKTQMIMTDLGYNCTKGQIKHFEFFGKTPKSKNTHPIKRLESK